MVSRYVSYAFNKPHLTMFGARPALNAWHVGRSIWRILKDFEWGLRPKQAECQNSVRTYVSFRPNRYPRESNNCLTFMERFRAFLNNHCGGIPGHEAESHSHSPVFFHVRLRMGFKSDLISNIYQWTLMGPLACLLPRSFLCCPDYDIHWHPWVFWNRNPAP